MEPLDQRAAALEAASIESSHQGVKALLLLNGGACIAILGFLANVMSDDLDWRATQFMTSAIRSLVFFAVGAGLAVFTTLVAYLTNQSYSEALQTGSERLWFFAQALNWLAILVALSSLCGFGLGVWEIAKSIN